MLGLLGDVAEEIDVSDEGIKVCLCHVSEPASSRGWDSGAGGM